MLPSSILNARIAHSQLRPWRHSAPRAGLLVPLNAYPALHTFHLPFDGATIVLFPFTSALMATLRSATVHLADCYNPQADTRRRAAAQFNQVLLLIAPQSLRDKPSHVCVRNQKASLAYDLACCP